LDRAVGVEPSALFVDRGLALLVLTVFARSVSPRLGVEAPRGLARVGRRPRRGH
jgi:hypothetical protein